MCRFLLDGELDTSRKGQRSGFVIYTSREKAEKAAIYYSIGIERK